MFDIGFLEILVIAVVGLLVIGPNQLPGAIRSGALWFGRIRRSIRNARAEIEQQIGADEIRREIHNEDVLHRLNELKTAKERIEQKVQESTQESIDDFEAHSHGPSHRPEDSHPPCEWEEETPSAPTAPSSTENHSKAD